VVLVSAYGATLDTWGHVVHIFTIIDIVGIALRHHRRHRHHRRRRRCRRLQRRPDAGVGRRNSVGRAGGRCTHQRARSWRCSCTAGGAKNPPRGVSRNDGAVPIFFCRADVLLARRRATSLPRTLQMLPVFVATFPSVVAARAGGGTGSWGRRISGGGGWHRQCAWDGDGRRVGAHFPDAGGLHCRFTRAI